MRIKKSGWFRHEELLALGVFGPRSRIGDRIEILLRRGRTFSSRASPGRIAASAAVLLMLLVVGSFAPRWIAYAQQPPRPSFEAASIKPGDPNDQRVGIATGIWLSVTNGSLKTLIEWAYHVSHFQISGGPNWLDSAKYDIEAKPDSARQILSGSAARTEQMRLMTQSLLAHRFKLAIHRETKQEPIYDLVVAKGGSKLKEVVGADEKTSNLQFGMLGITGNAAPLSIFTSTLSRLVGRSVIDKTELAGKYNFHLEYTPKFGQAPFDHSLLAMDMANRLRLLQNGPSIFTALREQLGLELVSVKGPVEVLVIDHAERPDAN